MIPVLGSISCKKLYILNALNEPSYGTVISKIQR